MYVVICTLTGKRRERNHHKQFRLKCCFFVRLCDGTTKSCTFFVHGGNAFALEAKETQGLCETRKLGGYPNINRSGLPSRSDVVSTVRL